MHGRNVLLISLLIVGTSCPVRAAGYRTSVGSGADEIAVVVVSGTAYQMGHTYGRLMAPEIKACLAKYLSTCQAAEPNRCSNAALDKAWKMAKPHVNARFIEEMQGLAAGAGMDYVTIRRAHSISLVMDYACSGVAVWSEATANGHLYQIRNLDFGTDLGLQDYPVIAVYLPQNGVAHANVAFAGYIGSHAGLSAAGIALTEKGASPGSDYPFALEGVPFFVLLRNILQDARSLSEAKRIVTDAKRHKKYYFVIGDGDEPAAVKIRAFAPALDIWGGNDPKDEVYPKVLPNAVYVTMDNDAAWRHLNENYGKYDAARMIEISRLVHGGANLLNVVYDATSREMWVAYAEGSEDAYQRQYVHFALDDYLSPKGGN